MDIVSSSFVFVLGLIIGSFLNVVIFRYNTGQTLGGRSKCMSCGKTLEWYELIPVLSYLLLLGRCSKCRSKISAQYILVEFSTAFVFLFTYWKLASRLSSTEVSLAFIFALAGWALLIAILVYDLRHKIIPDIFVWSFSICALVSHILTVGVKNIVWTLIAGPLLFLPFYLLWKVSGGRWIGLGDGKLAWGMGWFLGIGLGLSAVVISFWIGAVISLLIIAVAKIKHKRGGLGMKSEIPFAPFLIAGLALTYFLNLDVMGIYVFFGI